MFCICKKLYFFFTVHDVNNVCDDHEQLLFG